MIVSFQRLKVIGHRRACRSAIVRKPVALAEPGRATEERKGKGVVAYRVIVDAKMIVLWIRKIRTDTRARGDRNFRRCCGVIGTGAALLEQLQV